MKTNTTHIRDASLDSKWRPSQKTTAGHHAEISWEYFRGGARKIVKSQTMRKSDMKQSFLEMAA